MLTEPDSRIADAFLFSHPSDTVSPGHKPQDTHHKVFLVTMSEGPYPIPSRTRKSSPPEPMVLRARVRGRVGRCQVYYQSPDAEMHRGFSLSVRDDKNALLEVRLDTLPDAMS